MGAWIFQFLGAGLVIVAAGAALTRSADSIAEKSGLGRFFVGSILLAAATSLPELSVDLQAIRLGQPDLAVGDLLGSSLFNVLILAVVDAVFRLPDRTFTQAFAQHAKSAMLAIHLTAWVGMSLLSRLSVSFLGVGLFNWVVVAIYFMSLYRSYERPSLTENGAVVARTGFMRPLAGFAASAGVIVLVSPYLVEAADQIALLSGLGHTFMGTTFVALSTSLPEIVATITAFRLGAPDLALGNIFGSNAFNMILFFPLDFIFEGALFASVRAEHALTAFCVVAVTSVAALGLVSGKKGKARIWESGAALIIALSFAFLYLLYVVK